LEVNYSVLGFAVLLLHTTMEQVVSEDKNEQRLQEAAQALGRRLLSQAETKQEAGRLLLDGWKMMAESCPVTEYPLFMNKKTGEVWSVRLQMPVKLQSEGLTAVNPAEPAARPARVPPTPTDLLSSVIGQKLLLGWEMLNENIDGCPVLVDPENGRKWLPSSQRYLDAEPQAPSKEPRARKLDTSTEQGRDSIPYAKPVAKTQSSPTDEDLISERIGLRLLEGWEMLGESCPVTQRCPLMKDPVTGRLWSAALNDFVNSVSRNDDRTKPEGLKVETNVGLNAPFLSNAANLDDQVADEALRSALNEQLVHWSSLLKAATDVEKSAKILGLIQQALSIRKEL
jgi:uncharacterized Zn finger protein (UPF0148 family)